MSDLKLMAKQSSHYFIGYALSMVASFISFPIYTRLFSLSDYGVLSLISTTVFFVMAVGKFGMQNSIIRFYGEAKNNNKSVQLKDYYATLFFGPIVIIGIISLLYGALVFVLKRSIGDSKAMNYFMLSAVWTFFMCSNIVIKNFLRAEQNTKLYNLLNVLSKYISLVLGVSLVYFVFRTLAGLYFAFIATEASIFIYLTLRLRKRVGFHLMDFNKDFFIESLLYGIPLIGMELTNILLNVGDRYAILYFMDTSAVGLYSAGYDLGMCAMETLIFPLSFAITPIYMGIWAEKGKKETSIFLEKCLRFFLMIALPCIFGLNYLSKDITILLASKKFEYAYVVVPFVSWGVLFFGLTNIFNAGLLLSKNSNQLAFWTMITGIGNVLLNIILIPKFGLIGAALATFMSYLFLVVILAQKSFMHLKFKIDYFNISKYFIFSLIMIAFLHMFSFDSSIISILLKLLLGIMIYAVLLLTFDKDVREKISSFLANKEMRYDVLKFFKIHV